MNKIFNFLIDPKTGAELFFPSHLLPREFFREKTEEIKPKRDITAPLRTKKKIKSSRIFSTRTKELLESKPFNICSRALLDNGYLGEYKKVGGNGILAGGIDLEGNPKWILEMIDVDIDNKRVEETLKDKNNPSPFIFEKRIDCIDDTNPAKRLTLVVVNEKVKGSIKIGEILPLIEDDETLQDLFEGGEMAPIINELIKIHKAGWILDSGAKFQNVYAQSNKDGDGIEYIFMDWGQSTKRNKVEEYQVLIDLFNLYKSGDKREFLAAFKPFFDAYLNESRVKKSIERLNKNLALRRNVPFDFIVFMEDYGVLKPMHLHSSDIPRGCPEMEDIVYRQDDIKTYIYKDKGSDGKYIQVKRNKGGNDCSKSLNYIALKYLYREYNGDLAPLITAMDACYNTNLDECQENVYFTTRTETYETLGSISKERLWNEWFMKDNFFDIVFGLVKFSYRKAHVLSISPALDNFVIVAKGGLRLMGWNNALIVNKDALELGEYSFMVSDVLLSHNNIVIHWAIDTLILYYSLIFAIYKSGKTEVERDAMLSKLDNYYYPKVVKELVEMGLESLLSSKVFYWQQTIHAGGIPMETYLRKLIVSEVPANKETQKLYNETSNLTGVFRKIIGKAKLTIFIDSRSICLNQLAKEGWKYNKPKFMGSGSSGIVFSVCKDAEQHCPYVFKVQNAISKEQLDVLNDIKIYDIIGHDGGGIAPRLYGYKVCPYVSGSFITQEGYSWTGIGIYQRMKEDMWDYVEDKMGDKAKLTDEYFEEISNGKREGLLTEAQIKRMIEIIKELHEKGIIHYDSKLDNFLMGFGNDTNNDIYITDFGFSKYIDKYLNVNKFYTGVLVDYSKLRDDLRSLISDDLLDDLLMYAVYDDVKSLLARGAELSLETLPHDLKHNLDVINVLNYGALELFQN